jgi:biotin synthase-like enzyme
MKDPYNCKHEYEQEEIEMEALRQHEEGNCPGYPQCGYCADLRDERQEKDKAEGFYIGPKWMKE